MKHTEILSVCGFPPAHAAKAGAGMLAVYVVVFLTMPALGQGITRNWTGADSANWSDPDNWSPAGVPGSGDTLQFGVVSDSHRIMQNDLSGVQVTNLFFRHNNYTINGNAITTAEIYNSADDYTDNTSFTTTINCPLVFGEDTSGDWSIYSEAPIGTFTQSTINVHFNGPITIGLNGLSIFAGIISDNSSVGGGNSHIYVSGSISGNGDVIAIAADDGFGLNHSSIQFDGTQGNTFTGVLSPVAEGGALIIFNKSSGFVVTNGLSIWPYNPANVELAGANQIGNNANITLNGEGHLTFSGNNNITVGSIIFTNIAVDPFDPGTDYTLDTGTITVGLNGGIAAASFYGGIIPTIKGKINFNGQLPVEVDGTSTPGLDIQAVIEGAGFNKTGSGSLQLDADNTFYGNLEISSGYVVPTSAAALSPSASAGVVLNGGTLSLTSQAVNTDPLFVNSSNSTLITYGTCSWGGPVTLNQSLNLIPEDTTLAGLVTTFSGAITGSGGMTLESVFLAAGNVEFSGSSANTFSGPLIVQCHNLNLDKPAHTEAFGGPLTVGSGPGVVCQVTWLNHYQGLNEGAVTVYTNGIVDLNGYNDNFGPVTYIGGIIETFSGNLSLFGTVTVNPAPQIAYLDGNITLPPGNPVEFDVPQGYTVGGPELSCQSAISGSAPSLIKQGFGTLSLAGPNSSQANTLVEQGIVEVDNPMALGATPVVIASGATVQFDLSATLSQDLEMSGDGFLGSLGAISCTPNSFATLNGNVMLDAETTLNPVGSNSLITLGGLVYGAGPLTKIGAGYLYFTGNSANTYSGTTYANQGTLELSKADGVIAVPGNLAIGTRTSLFNNNGTTATVLQNQSGSIGGTNVTVNGGSQYLLEGHNQSLASVNLNGGGAIQTDFGTLTLTGGSAVDVVSVNPGQNGASLISGYLNLASGGNFAIASRFTLGAAPELDLQAGLNDQFASAISKSGTGRMQLSAANSFSSAMTVNGGTLIVPNSSALGNSASMTVNCNSILLLENGITIQNKSLTLNSTNPAALESLNGSNTWSGDITFGPTGSIVIGPTSGYLNLPGAISGPGGLTTGGTGTLQLEGTNANTYAGLTMVGSGVLEAARYAIEIKRHIAVGGGYYYTTNKVSQICIPGDIVIGSDSPDSYPAVLQIDYLQQFPTTANIADHQSGSLNFIYLGAGQLQPAVDTIQSLTGSGQVNLVLNSSLSIDNSSPFTFYGSVNGDGAFGFGGPGTMTTWGNFNTTGAVGIGGGDWEFFGARHNGGIIVNGGRLAGDGTVDGPVVVSGAYDGASLGVESHLPNPQASVFHMGSLSNGPSVAIQLPMFGPSPAGGNDQIATTSGGVTLASDTVLQTSFNYPPRAGDVIDLITVAAGQNISGNFTNFPDGVVTLVGGTPVLPSYQGGAGHDFTLTVTNLALAYVGYQLAEGNGNQTVEPDECNLLYVSLVNRRATPLTVTNAYLLATNAIGVVVTLPVAAFPVIPAGQTQANMTPFQFSTDTNLPCGGAVGFELVLGVVNEGQFAIDFSPVSGTDCSHPTGPCDSCTVVSGEFTTNTPTTANALYFTGAPSICYPPKAYPGTNPIAILAPVPYLTHNFTNSTTNTLCLTAALDFACAAAPTNALGVAAYLGTFDPNNPSVAYLGDIGQGGPPYPVFSFQVPPGTNFTLVVIAQATNLPCSNYSLQLFGLPCPPPTLAIEVEPSSTNHVRVNWSTAYPGFMAQQASRLNGGMFSNVIQSPVILTSRYALTNLSLTATNQFYRLMK